MPKKAKYGYRRDIFGRVYESDTYKDDVHFSTPNYDYSSFDSEDDHDFLYSDYD